MAGFFPSTGQTMVQGRVHRALYGSIGVQTSLRATLGVYYGLGGGSVSLSSSFAGRYYGTPYTY
jgi:hypothetical protein